MSLVGNAKALSCGCPWSVHHVTPETCTYHINHIQVPIGRLVCLHGVGRGRSERYETALGDTAGFIAMFNTSPLTRFALGHDPAEFRRARSPGRVADYVILLFLESGHEPGGHSGDAL
jgi:hypothetical protein